MTVMTELNTKNRRNPAYIHRQMKEQSWKEKNKCVLQARYPLERRLGGVNINFDTQKDARDRTQYP